ncbi:MAG: cytochrome c biogenesis CcdA family protein [Patescibacteria group bacterium]|nr:MAG: cytochrome c biogenesis CcdA family protein [Patescibacteria group bacterium]
MALEIFLALLAGILTIAAPCIAVPLPIIFASSLGKYSKLRPLFITLGFVITFSVLALSLTWLIRQFSISPNIGRNLAAGFLALFALFMIWPALFEKLMSRFSFLSTKATSSARQAGQGPLGGLYVGAIIGLVWAPCAGPILGSILTLVAKQEDLTKAGLLLLAYAIGAGLPMLAIAYGGQYAASRLKMVAVNLEVIRKIFGFILLLLALAIYFQYDLKIQALILSYWPSLVPKL